MKLVDFLIFCLNFCNIDSLLYEWYIVTELYKLLWKELILELFERYLDAYMCFLTLSLIELLQKKEKLQRRKGLIC